MFEGFRRFDIDTGGATIHGVAGGSGPPLLLGGHYLAEEMPGEVLREFIAFFGEGAQGRGRYSIRDT